MWIAVAIGLYFLAVAGCALFGAVKRNRATLSLELRYKQQVLEREERRWEQRVEADKCAIQQLASEKTMGFPWLAEAYADYFLLKDLETADLLEEKDCPAPRAAETIRDVGRKRSKAEKLWRLCR